jgi:CelD/BcsL family acetyltransferase involved in cellulose biosynthesis
MLKEFQSNSWSLEIFQGEPEMLPQQWAETWDRLACQNTQATIFQEREFVTQWYKDGPGIIDGKFQICLGSHSPSGLQLILPMIQLPRSVASLWIKRCLAAGEPNFDYQEPLVSSGPLFKEHRESFWTAFGKVLFEAGIVRFTSARMSAEVSPRHAQRDASEKAWRSNLADAGTWAAFICTRAKSLRGDISRQLRRLEQKGPVRFLVYQPHEVQQCLSGFEEFKTCYRELWRGQPAERMFLRPGLEAWYRALIATHLPAGRLHFSRLQCGDETVAWHFGFLHHGVLHWYKPTYQKDFSPFSPGKLLLAKVIEEGIRLGWQAVDFGPGMEPYKLHWANESTEMFRWEWNSNRGVNRIVNWVRNRRSQRPGATE